MEPMILIDVDRCVGCYMCVRSCALAQCLEVNEVTRIVEVKRPEDCTVGHVRGLVLTTASQ